MAGIVWTGQVNFTDTSDVGTTGVATLTLTPDIGVSNLPALVNGTPGLPPTLRNVTVNQVAYGTTPPASTWTQVSAGGAGAASVYDLVLYVNSGATGATGATTISAASDVSGTATNGYTLVYSSATSRWVMRGVQTGDIYSASTATAYAGSATQATLATITVPAQAFDWRPDVEGYATAVGANTKIDLACYTTSATTGDQVGYGPGATGNARPILLQRAFGAAIGAGTYGRIAAGSAATLYLVAKQVNGGVSESWSVSASSVNFSVKVNPIPWT